MSRNPRNQVVEHPEDRGERWFLNGVIWLVSAVIIAGSISQRYWQGVGLGAVLAFWRVMATPEITNYLVVKINWKGRRQILRVEESPGAQAVQVGDNSRVKIETNPSQTAQQLAELVYTPLLKEATSWLDPMTPTYAVGTWSNLEAEKPYLIRLVPKDIAEIFNRAKLAWVQMSSLNLALFGTYEKALVAARQKLNLTQARPGQSQVTFRILSGPQFLGGVWLQKLWVSGKTLSEYGKEFVDTNFPGTDWEFDLQIDGMTATEDNNTALQFAEVALTYLSHEPKAVELQKKYSELKKLGIKARPRIDEELGKLVRLKV